MEFLQKKDSINQLKEVEIEITPQNSKTQLEEAKTIQDPIRSEPTLLPQKASHQKLKINYQPQIDGLRFLAIMGVVFYHFQIGFPGGFQGVDVFFVISGYLIHSLIVKGIIKKKFNMCEFWERRVRRLFFAIIFLFIVLCIVGWTLMIKADYMELCKEMMYCLLFIANFYFQKISLGGYFDQRIETYPLIHFWSLGIEQQFYLIIPISLYILSKLCRKTGALLWAIIVFLLVIYIVSLSLSIHYSPINQNFAYYLIPTRAWELATGCIVSMLCNKSVFERLEQNSCCAKIFFKHSELCKRILLQILSWTGIILILYSYFSFEKQKIDFPGYKALCPCMGAGLFIFGNMIRYKEVSGEKKRIILTSGRVFSLKPLVYIGKISYSLYLWHWIIWSLQHLYLLKQEPLGVHKLQYVILSIAIASFSTFYIQKLFRNPKLVSRKMIWILFAVSWAGMMIYLFTSYKTGFHKSPNDWIEQNGEKFDIDGTYNGNGYKNMEERYFNLPILTSSTKERKYSNFQGIQEFNSKSGESPKLVIYGSSHAMQHAELFKFLSLEYDLMVGMISHHGYQFLKEPLTQIQQQSMNKLKQWNPETVALLDYYTFWWGSDYQDKLRSTLNILIKYANPKRIMVFGHTPIYNHFNNEFFADYVNRRYATQGNLEFLNKLKTVPLEGRTQAQVEWKIQNIIKTEYTSQNVQFYPLKQFFMDSYGNIQAVGSETIGVSIYLDQNHLSPAGSKRLWNYFGEKLFKPFK